VIMMVRGTPSHSLAVTEPVGVSHGHGTTGNRDRDRDSGSDFNPGQLELESQMKRLLQTPSPPADDHIASSFGVNKFGRAKPHHWQLELIASSRPGAAGPGPGTS
jgi:hypothetical protein